jgi:hypothetical protein
MTCLLTDDKRALKYIIVTNLFYQFQCLVHLNFRFEIFTHNGIIGIVCVAVAISVNAILARKW